VHLHLEMEVEVRIRKSYCNTINSDIILDGHPCFSKTYKNMPPCWKLTLYYRPISNRSKSHGWLWILCGSQDQPLCASFVFFSSILQEGLCDYVALFLVFCFFLLLLFFCKGQFEKSLQKFWETALWLDHTLFKGRW